MKTNYPQLYCLLFFLFVVFIPQSSHAVSDSLITTNSSWKYLDNGSNQGTVWTAVGFSDATWASGNAQLGYGDGDETTVVNYGPAANNKYITTYFRKSFSIVNPALYSSLTLGILRDDGAVVYVNGTEVYRTNMPTGAIDYLVRAVSNINGAAESTYYYYTFSFSLLVAGTNTVSVELHQFNKTSDDISFSFNLAGLQIPQCITPTGLSTTAITSTTATLNWAAVTGAVAYKVEFRLVGAPTFNTTTTTTNSSVLTVLNPSSNYEWRVQTICSSNQSAFSPMENFTTLAFCDVPTGLNATAVTTTTATLNWSAVSGAAGYNIQYRIVGTPTWSTTTSITTSANISSLTPSSNYEWQVQTDCGSSNLSVFSASSNFTTATPPCNIPAGLNTTAITATTATLNWTAVSGAVSYNIQYRMVGAPTWITTTSATASVNISSLTSTSNYEWQVQTDCGGSNLSAFSGSSNFTTATPPCNIPAGLNTTSITTTAATLNWTAVSGAVSYYIQYRIVGAPTWNADTTINTFLNIFLLIPSSNYEWQVQSNCGSANLSAYSGSSNFTTASPPCYIPSGLNTTAITTTTASLNWTAVSGAVGYNIRYRIIGAPTWNTTVSAVASVNISLLTPTSNYEWQVQTNCGGSNLSAFSGSSNFTTATPLCNVPTGLNATAITTTAASLDWSVVSGALSYNIQYRIVGAPTWTSTISAIASVNISSLTPASNYEWQVQTDCGGSNLSAFSALSNFTTATPTCNTPTGLNATSITTTTATLNWAAVSGAVNYTIQYRIVGAPTWSTTTSATVSVNISTLTPSSNYQWQVQANCGASSVSAFSSASNFTTATPPCNTPLGLSATVITTTTATLNWTAMSGALSYNVRYRIVGAPTWSTTTAAINSANISSLTPASNYEWQVQSNCGGSNLSAFSASSNFTTALPPCNIPTGLSTTAITTTSATLNWTAVSGAVSYNIQYRIVGAPTWTSTTSSITSINISSLTPSSNYEWQVQTDCGGSNLSAFSASLFFTTATPPCNIPSGLNTTTITSTTATLNWTAVSGAVNYNIQYRIIGAPTWTSVISATTSLNITSLTPSSNYEWQVQTNCGGSNLSAFSGSSNFTTSTAPCNIPTGLNATNITASTATLNWSAAGGALSYNVRHRIVGSPTWLNTVSFSISLNIFSLTPSSVYEWQVQSNCSASSSAYASLSNFTTPAPPVCNASTGLNAINITTTTADINWGAVSGGLSYNVQYRVVGSPTWTSQSTTFLSLSLTSLLPGSIYEWQVQSVCLLNQSAFSSLSNFTTNPSSCSVPSGTITHSIYNTFAVLRWLPVTGALTYDLGFRAVGSPTFTTLNLSSTYYNLNSLTPNTAYEWRVQSNCGPAGVSGYSALVTFTTLVNVGLDSLITQNDNWRYLDKGFETTGWEALTFNDSQWDTGYAELGYGDSDEATVLSYGPDPNNKYITTYFRKVFSISNVSNYISYTLDVMRDDGVVVYLNGTEVYRNNMPAGTPANNTFASTSISGTDESAWYSISLSPILFSNGNNIVAAEIHQANLTSSDISFNLRLTANTLPIVTRGPYLQSITPNSIYVCWRTNTATSSRVRYGISPSTLEKTVVDHAAVIDHKILIDQFTASTRYYYTVENVVNYFVGDSSCQFLSPPAPGNTENVRIWGLGDFGSGNASQFTVRDAYKNYPGYYQTNLWIWLGDNAYTTGTDVEFQNNVFNVYQEQFRRFPLYPSPGNHDYAGVGYLSASALTTNFPYFDIVKVPTTASAGGNPSGTEKYYSYNYSDIHFISLDSYGAYNYSGSPMYTWLQSDLDSNQKKWTIVYFHHPPYTMGSHNSDTETELINMRQNIMPLLESRHVDLVLSGHSHVNERSYLLRGHFGNSSTFNSSMIVQGGTGAMPNPYVKTPPYNGTVYAVCGTGGQLASSVQTGYPMACMVYSNKNANSSLVIDIAGNQLNCKYLSSSGAVLDSFTIVKNSVRELQPGAVQDLSLFIYPNPFSDETALSYSLPTASQVRLELYNVLGEKVYSFTTGTEEQKEGIHEYTISASQTGLHSGVYLVHLFVNGAATVQRLVLVK